MKSEVPDIPARLLVMDDEHCIRYSAEQLLSGAGYEVDCASDGEEAVRKYREAMLQGSPYQLVILDLVVPDGPGAIAALSGLKAIDPEVKAVVISGYHDAPAMSHPHRHGFCASLPKPYEKEVLRELIDMVLKDQMRDRKQRCTE